MKNRGFRKKKTSNHPSQDTPFGRVIVRYTMFQIPSLVILILTLVIIRTWINLPGWLTGLCVAVWILKDLVLFPFVWRAYDPENENYSKKMVGKKGRVVERLAPQGYVELNGELWRAIIEPESAAVEKNAPVLVLDVQGLTLLVEQEADTGPDHEIHNSDRGV